MTFNDVSMIGRIVTAKKLHGSTPIGLRAVVRLERAYGRRSVLENMLTQITDMAPYENVRGERCSQSWYLRRDLSAYQRDLREIAGRKASGQSFSLFQSRQAS